MNLFTIEFCHFDPKSGAGTRGIAEKFIIFWNMILDAILLEPRKKRCFEFTDNALKEHFSTRLGSRHFSSGM
jgi:hypothetical protein